jgi:hypothetical protein
MGDINPSKMPKAKAIHRKDDPNKVDMYAKGGEIGLYANIHAKRKRIAKGSGEKMRPVGKPGAPTAKAFKRSALTAK